MAGFEALAAWIAALLLLYPVYLAKRDWFEARGLKVYPLTIVYKRGLSLESITPHTRGARALRALFTLGILVLIVDALLFYNFILASTAARLTGKVSGPTLTPIIPGVTVSLETFAAMLPGIAVAILAHEASHAIASRVEGIPVKSTGIALVAGVIPVAFVEPDREAFLRAKLVSKLRILSAGVLANTLIALIALNVMPLLPGSPHLVIVQVKPGSPADKAGLEPGDEILLVNGTPAASFDVIRSVINASRTVNITVLRNGEVYSVLVNPVEVNGSKMIGVVISLRPPSVFHEVLYWMLVLNHWLALLNAAPLIVTDGGQALTEVLRRLLREKGYVVSIALQSATIALLVANAGLVKIG